MRVNVIVGVLALFSWSGVNLRLAYGAAEELQADPFSASWCFETADDAMAWSEGTSSLGELTELPATAPAGVGELLDGAVQPSQFLAAPPMLQSTRQPVRTAARNPRPALRGAAASGLASVPYMIGDTGAGTCLGFSGLLDIGLAHPTLACGRLNVAEANTPLPTDRVYYSYRHFEAATPLNVYQFGEELDVDRHTLAFERTYWDGMCSVEMRMPLEHRLSSETTSLLTPAGIDLTSGNSQRTELANVSLIFKSLLLERQTWALSGGMGVTLPTAQSVQYDVGLTGNVDYGNGLTADTISAFQTDFANETVYLLPFLSWMYAPNERWFHQGFLQIEAAANPSTMTAFGGGAYNFYQNGVPFGAYGYATGPGPVGSPIPVRTELHAQTLLRTNLGFGYNFWESATQNAYGGSRDRFAGLFEVHYTSTLQDAKLSEVQITSINFNTPPDLQQILIGNINNRVDILNLASGVTLTLGDTTLTTGVVAPIRDCPDCGFEVEYNTQVQRRF